MKKPMLLTAASLLLLTVFSCKKSSNNPPANSASVMVVNGCTGTANTGVTVTAGGTAIGNASNMAFLKTSGYQYITAGSSVNIVYNLTGVGTLVNGTLSATTDQHYSVFAGGSITHPTYLAASDDLTVVSGMAKVRFVNLSPDALNEKCYIGNVAIDSNISANSIGQYHSIAAATGTTVTMDDPATFPANLAQLSSTTFSAGKVYTVMLTGTAVGSGAPGLAITVITNY